ncbi:hypothetical protein TPAR_05786 [Tolypocladium paradoxum]|uniref:Uncharacterized protein n=1 Tax=Tolypocladium paradoxum TaxID=94208 RepID=A0A2S4KUZ0_9HYPO|nr:hypothetical protein TPAR_05786 [Tolypocladium paradoxum]
MTSEIMLRTAGMVSGSISLSANDSGRQNHEAVLVFAQNLPHSRVAHFYVHGPPEPIDGMCEMEALHPLGELLTDSMGDKDEISNLAAILVILACWAHTGAAELMRLPGRRCTRLVRRLHLVMDAVPRLSVEPPYDGNTNREASHNLQHRLPSVIGRRLQARLQKECLCLILVNDLVVRKWAVWRLSCGRRPLQSKLDGSLCSSLALKAARCAEGV